MLETRATNQNDRNRALVHVIVRLSLCIRSGLQSHFFEKSSYTVIYFKKCTFLSVFKFICFQILVYKITLSKNCNDLIHKLECNMTPPDDS